MAITHIYSLINKFNTCSYLNRRTRMNIEVTIGDAVFAQTYIFRRRIGQHAAQVMIDCHRFERFDQDADMAIKSLDHNFLDKFGLDTLLDLAYEAGALDKFDQFTPLLNNYRKELGDYSDQIATLQKELQQEKEKSGWTKIFNQIKQALNTPLF